MIAAMETKNVFIIDLSALSKNPNVNNGIFDWENCLYTVKLIYIFDTNISIKIDQLLFLSEQNVEIGADIPHRIFKNGTGKIWNN